MIVVMKGRIYCVRVELCCQLLGKVLQEFTTIQWSHLALCVCSLLN